MDVRDVAEVHAAAVDNGEPGKRYIIGGDKVHSKELGAIIDRLTGVTPKHFGAGRRLSSLIARFAEIAAKITGSEPMITRDIVYEGVERYGYFDSQTTYDTFGITPRGAEEVLRDSIRWLLYRGEFKPALAERLVDKFPPDPAWN